MNVLDIIILVILIFLVIRGVFRGFVREIASLAGIVLGIWLGVRLLPDMTAFLKHLLPSIRLIFLQVISFGVIFVVVLILCNLLGRIIQALFRKALLGWLDRCMGAGLAILKGIIVTYLAVWLLILYVPASNSFIANSRLIPVINSFYQSITGWISPQRYMALKEKLMKNREKEAKNKKESGRKKGGIEKHE